MDYWMPIKWIESWNGVGYWTKLCQGILNAMVTTDILLEEMPAKLDLTWSDLKPTIALEQRSQKFWIEMRADIVENTAMKVGGKADVGNEIAMTFMSAAKELDMP